VNDRVAPASPNRGVDGHDITPRAWLPLGFVLGALLLLLVTPFVINRISDGIRIRRLDVTNEARVFLSEFEGAFAEELVIAAAAPDSALSDEAHRLRAIAMEARTQHALDSVLAQFGGESGVRLAALDAAEDRWRAINPPTERAPVSAALRRRRAAVGREVLDAAEALHDELLAVSNIARDELLRLDRINLFGTAALASIALIAMLIAIAMERRVRRYAKQADDRARSLERSVELRASLIHGVVHDVKNPLGAASGYAELLEEGVAGPLTEQQTEMVRRFKRLIATALQTIAELVDLARVDAGEFTIESRETNLVSTVRRIVDDHQARATTNSIHLTFDPAGDALWVRTDPARVRHVVENLLANAIKYTPPNGAVRVAISTDQGDGRASKACVSVRDTGPGVPPEMRDRIFDPFFRMPSSEHRTTGSGLGLAISRRIAGLLGGKLTVTDAPGGGADFSFTLPIDGDGRGPRGDQ
jgi:Osmosensitive K+ channel histidine kinase